MSPLSLVRRVEVLEEHVDLLNQLPERVRAVEGQLIALRGDFVSLRSEVREGNEETRRQMRVLHEDVISRIALLQEGASHAKARRSRRKGGSPRS